MNDDKVKAIWDSIVPDLVEEHFPKGECKERGQALVLVALIYCKLLPKLFNALNKPRIDHNCTTAKMAEQLNIPLWKVMELGKYFKERFKPRIDYPKIICLCGSTRFADLHTIKRWEFEKDGKAICLMINYLPMNYAKEMGWNKPDHLGEQAGNKQILDELHLRKIDLADEVFVINVGGYIGESTRKEINYAQKLGKPIKYLEPR